MNKLLLFLTFLSVTVFAPNNFYGQACNMIYVSTIGSGTGDISDPTDFNTALTIAAVGDVIRMDSGTYVISSPLIIPSGVTIEGGFIAAENWRKYSTAGLTKIYRDASNPEGTQYFDRIVAFYGISATNFRFQDITIESAGATTQGTTVYGVHLNNCSNYNFTRTQVIAGQGGPGIDGVAGVNGLNGSNGGNGTDGDNDEQNNSGVGGNGGAGAGPGFGSGGAGAPDPPGGNVNGIAGSTGSTSTVARSGGGGGGGGSGGGERHNGGNGGAGGAYFGGSINGNIGAGGGASKCDGKNGWPGGNGANGVDGADGAVGPAGTYAGGFFVPGLAGANGQPGTGGVGGAGGGGGGGQGDADFWGPWCIYGAGSGGGGGGGGGQGGTGGTGGTGGGGSFAVYLYNNGANAFFNQDNLVTLGGGPGGVGGAGGIGGSGGTRGLGSPYTSGGEVGAGGNGGNGGAGGNGGKGGDGAVGDFMQIYLDGGTPPVTQDISFDLVNQPIITMENSLCLKDVFDYGASNPNAWVFGSGSSPITVSGTTGQTMYLDRGRHDVVFGTDLYQGFNYVTDISPNIADAGVDSVICDNNNIYNLWGNTPENGTGTWTVLSGTSTVDNPNQENSTINLTEGVTVLEWKITGNNCCGSTTDTVTITYNTVSVIPTSIAGNSLVCIGDTITLEVNSGQIGTGANWEWYEGSCGGTPIGTGAQINVSPTVPTTYYVAPVNGVCPITPGCYSELVSVGSFSTAPTSLQLSQQNICGHDTTIVKQIGGVLSPGELWYWTTDSCGGQVIGYGDSISVAPLETTTYYLHANNSQCQEFNCESVTLNVISTMVSFEWTDTICGVFEPYDLSGLGNPTGGVFTGPAITNNVFEPALVGPGVYPITYTYYDDTSSCYVPIYDAIPVNLTCDDDVTEVNTITPNGDGVNDTWQLDLSKYSAPEVIIYNKWGSVIFRSTKSYVQWDATFKGNPVASGVYYYLVRFGNEKPQQSGSLNVIR